MTFVKENSGPTAIDSKLGYLLSGPVEIARSFSGIVNTHSLKVQQEIIGPEKELNEHMKNFWNLELIGISPKEKSVLDEFRDTIEFKDERYEVRLPFKENVHDLPDNYEICKKRLKGLWNNFKNNTELFREYEKIINEQKNISILEQTKHENIVVLSKNNRT